MSEYTKEKGRKLTEALRRSKARNSQPDAIERLENWLEESVDRFVVQVNWNPARDGSGGFRVALGNRVTGARQVAYEYWPVDTESWAIAKEPGLDATIHAAIDKATELGL